MRTTADGQLRRMLPDLVRIRRYLHRHPESAYEEVGTAALVERELRACGLEVVRVGRTGVMGLLRGRRGGKTVALRADMDALRMKERTHLPYASANDRMHACGHDGHTAILIGAARVLSAMRERLRGSVKFIFQPAEEGGAGARTMVDGGVMESPRVGAIFALHAFPWVDLGRAAVRGGTIMAAADNIFLKVHGKGGHGAGPEQTVDPIVISARIIDALQTISSREVAATAPVVVTVGTIHGGTATNIIPASVEMSGTIRTLDAKVRQHAFEAVRRIATRTARAFRGRCSVTIRDGYPATVNDESLAELVRRVGQRVLGRGKVSVQTVSMGAEDFCLYLKHAPGCFFRLGIREKSRPIVPLHSPLFDFNDKAIPHGVRMMVGCAVEFLSGRE